MAEFDITVYGLCSSQDHVIRYVGVTKNRPIRRLQQHLSKTKTGERSHKATWIRKVLASGFAVELQVIEIANRDNWIEREKHFIGTLPNLTNLCAGGEGVMDPAPEVRARVGRYERTPEIIQRLKDAHAGNSYRLGKKATPETRRRVSESHMGIVAGMLGKRHSEETRQKIGIAGLGRKHTEETKAKMRQTRARPEVRMRMRQARMEQLQRQRAAMGVTS